MILYADDIAVVSKDVDERAEILNIYDKTFTRFGLKIATDKTKNIASNVPEETDFTNTFCFRRNEYP